MALDSSGIMSVPQWTVWGNGDHQGAYPSDRRLKTNIQPFPSMLDKLARLQPVNFDWRKSNPHGYPSGDRNNPGLIAQDVEKLFPAMVTTDENGFRRLSYGQLPLMLLEGVRELKQRNDNLVAEVQTQSKQLASENAEIIRLKRVSSAKDADVRNEGRQIRTLAREVEKLEKSQAEMAALEARLARLEGKSQSGSRNVSTKSRKTGKTSKPKVVQIARVGF